MSHIIERVALALPNDDRTRHGLPMAASLDAFSDREAYRSSAREAMRAMKYHDGWDEDVVIEASRIGLDGAMIAEALDAYIDAAIAQNDA